MKLEIKNLKINLDKSEKEIIKEASLVLNQGDIVLLNGENGSGKSSLLSAIFQHPNFEIISGEFLKIDEAKNETINLLEKKTFEIAKEGIYLSLQHVPEIHGVNLLQFLYRTHKNIFPESNLSILDFNKELINFAKKYEIDESFLSRDLNVGFSGGEKKQAEMFHLFSIKPQFVFMDEIDSGVDKEAIKKVFKIISDFNEEYKTAFCLISHKENIENYIKVTKIYEMKNGILNLIQK